MVSSHIEQLFSALKREKRTSRVHSNSTTRRLYRRESKLLETRAAACKKRSGHGASSLCHCLVESSCVAVIVVLVARNAGERPMLFELVVTRDRPPRNESGLGAKRVGEQKMPQVSIEKGRSLRNWNGTRKASDIRRVPHMEQKIHLEPALRIIPFPR
jgi:hypothetical protein